MRRLHALVSAVVLCGVCGSTSYAQSIIRDIGPDLAVIRQSTAKYHQVEKAIADGYTAVPVAGNPGGIDALFLSYPAVLDGPPPYGIPGVFKLDEPEGLGYVKLPNGKLRLASVFFFVPYPAIQDSDGAFQPDEAPPIWLGHEPAANVIYGFWEMEVWVWVNNPNGLFDFVNPRFLEDWDER